MKKWLLIICLLGRVAFLSAQTTEEDATVLARLYETMADNFLQFIEDLSLSSQAEETVQIIESYVADNEPLFSEMDIRLKPFMNGTRPYRLKRAMDQAQDALNRMSDIVPLLEPYMENPSVREAWNGFLILYGLEGR